MYFAGSICTSVSLMDCWPSRTRRKSYPEPPTLPGTVQGTHPDATRGTNLKQKRYRNKTETPPSSRKESCLNSIGILFEICHQIKAQRPQQWPTSRSEGPPRTPQRPPRTPKEVGQSLWGPGGSLGGPRAVLMAAWGISGEVQADPVKALGIPSIPFVTISSR